MTGRNSGYTRDEIQAVNNLLYINSMGSYATSVSLLNCNNLHCSWDINTTDEQYKFHAINQII